MHTRTCTYNISTQVLMIYNRTSLSDTRSGMSHVHPRFVGYACVVVHASHADARGRHVDARGRHVDESDCSKCSIDVAV
jgi:hypothetical protein